MGYRSKDVTIMKIAIWMWVERNLSETWLVGTGLEYQGGLKHPTLSTQKHHQKELISQIHKSFWNIVICLFKISLKYPSKALD